VEGVLGAMWRDVWLGGVYSYCHHTTSGHTGQGHTEGPGAAVMVLGECVYTTPDEAATPGGHR
jgi:uncharacterized protein YjlB